MKRLAAFLLALFFAAPPAAADDYPNRPIRVFTTSSAGGISDIFMRVLGEQMRSRLGQPLVIENRPGGAGNIGARACARTGIHNPGLSGLDTLGIWIPGSRLRCAPE